MTWQEYKYMLSKETLDSQENKNLFFFQVLFTFLYISRKKRELSNEMNKYVNVSFRYDNVLMHHTVHKFVMPEAHSFLFIWLTNKSQLLSNFLMYVHTVHQSSSLNGLHNSISNWSTMICVGWLYMCIWLYIMTESEETQAS